MRLTTAIVMVLLSSCSLSVHNKELKRILTKKEKIYKKDKQVLMAKNNKLEKKEN
jgi:hypothetical protein